MLIDCNLLGGIKCVEDYILLERSFGFGLLTFIKQIKWIIEKAEKNEK